LAKVDTGQPPVHYPLLFIAAVFYCYVWVKSVILRWLKSIGEERPWTLSWYWWIFCL